MGLCNDIDDVIDAAIIDRNCWLLYGSKKLENHSYKVSHNYTYINDKIIDVPLYADDKDYIQLFSMRNKAICWAAKK